MIARNRAKCWVRVLADGHHSQCESGEGALRVKRQCHSLLRTSDQLDHKRDRIAFYPLEANVIALIAGDADTRREGTRLPRFEQCLPCAAAFMPSPSQLRKVSPEPPRPNVFAC